MKSVTFEGIPSGDMECFCWDVDKKTYIAITGEIPEEENPAIREIQEELGRTKCTYRLYPGDILRACGYDDVDPNRKKKIKITVSVEELD